MKLTRNKGLERLSRSGTKLQYQFPRDNEGDLDVNDGKPKERDTELKMKYTKEARFMLGMRLDLDEDGEIKTELYKGEERLLGVVLPMKEHTESKVSSYADFMDAFIKKRNEPKKAKDTGPWVQDTWDKKKHYKGDLVTTLPSITKSALECLATRRTPVRTVGECYDWFYCKPKRRAHFVKNVKGISNTIQLKAEALAEKAEPGVPKIIDHRKESNPWKSRYGDDWKEHIMDTADMKMVTNVRDLVEHMVLVGEEHYKGTRYENKWCFYHDALSLMCSEENLRWMKHKGYLKYWILPEHELNDMFPHYKKRPMPVGNHAGAMPWDQTCNKDHDDVVLRHVAATSRLDVDDPRKFSLRTPKKVADAYKRIYNNPVVFRDGEPLLPQGECGIPADRLGHDIVAVIGHWHGVFESQGLNTETNTSGWRGGEVRDAAREGKIKKKRGGKRPKRAVPKDKVWTHPDAKEALELLIKESWDSCQRVLKKTKEKYGKMTKKDEPAMDPEAFDVTDDQSTSVLPAKVSVAEGEKTEEEAKDDDEEVEDERIDEEEEGELQQGDDDDEV